MRAGELRHRVTIKSTVETDDGHHGFDETTTVVASRAPASVEPLSGRELERAHQIEPRTTHRVRLRYRAGLKAGQALTFHTAAGDREFEIVAPPIDVDERRRELHLMCKENAT